MRSKNSQAFWQALSLGILAGMRSAAAPAIASHILSRHPHKNLSNSSLKFMQSKKVANGLKVSAAGELVVDKLPFAPDRIAPAGVMARCFSGGLAGASIYKAKGNNAITGAFIGSTAALISTFCSYYLRRELVKKAHIDDPIVGALEDSLVIGSAIILIRSA